MHLYSYKAPKGRYALLAEDDPGLLPAELGPWKKFTEIDLNPGDPDQLGVPTAETLANIEAHGCHMFQFTMTFE